MFVETEKDNEEVRTFLDSGESRRMREANGKRRAGMASARQRAVEKPTAESAAKHRQAAIKSFSRCSELAPLWVRVCEHVVDALLLPNRLQRFRKALRAWPIRAHGFLVAILGPRVSEAVAQSRLAVCGACPFLEITLTRGSRESRLYCTSCACPRWFFSRLDRKTRYLNAGCPEGRFPGRPDLPGWDAIRKADSDVAPGIVDEMLATRQAVPHRQASGCGGCGGGSH